MKLVIRPGQDPEIVIVRGIFSPANCQHTSSSRKIVILPGMPNDHLVDEKSTGGMVISLRITSSGTGNYQLIDEKSTEGMGFHRE
jgi:hypothetical protein